MKKEQMLKDKALTKNTKNKVTAKNSKKVQNSKGIVISGIKITHPDRMMDPTKTVHKEQVARYYDLISDKILPHLVNRPLVLVRCPSGGMKGKACFFQKHYNKSFSKDIKPINVGKSSDYITITNKQGLLSLIQFNTLEIHPWGSAQGSLDMPDRITFDLDPDPEIHWKKVIEAALIIRKELKNLKLKSFVKTSGGKGLHIVIPILPKHEWYRVTAFAGAFAHFLSELYPERFTATVRKSKRTGKIFLDYLRNVKDATSVAPYSTRAREGAPLSMPIQWKNIKTVKSANQFTVTNIKKWLIKNKKDPWLGFFQVRQQIPI